MTKYAVTVDRVKLISLTEKVAKAVRQKRQKDRTFNLSKFLRHEWKEHLTMTDIVSGARPRGTKLVKTTITIDAAMEQEIRAYRKEAGGFNFSLWCDGVLYEELIAVKAR